MLSFPTLQDFFGSSAADRYNRALWIATTPEQDKAIYDYASKNYRNTYGGLANNCGDLVKDSLAAGNVTLPWETVTKPNTQYRDVLRLPNSAPFIPPKP